MTEIFHLLKKKTGVVHCPRNWIQILVTAGPSNRFTVIYMEQDNFKYFGDVERYMKKTGDFKITKNMWLQLNADDLTSYVCVSTQYYSCG